MNNLIATVEVDKTFFSFDTDYSYVVPRDLIKMAQLGCTVSVPFGKANTIRQGIIVALEDGDDDKLKPINSIGEKVLSDEMVSLALWLKERCFCTTYDCLRQMLPRGFGKIHSKSERMVRLLKDNEEELSGVTKKQRIVCDLLLDVGSAAANEVCEFCSVGIGVLKNLEKDGIIEFYRREVLRNPYFDTGEGKQTLIGCGHGVSGNYSKAHGRLPLYPQLQRRRGSGHAGKAVRLRYGQGVYRRHFTRYYQGNR